MRSSTTGGQAVRRLSSSSSTVGHRSSSQRESMPSSIHTAIRASMSQGRQPVLTWWRTTLQSQSVARARAASTSSPGSTRSPLPTR
ncbi:MAG TPA: hypothetical protein VK975_06000, partial [Acidimicrobiales bacterium]|nr:hypothetical protein [Acidimicrobiales bacterium]